MENRPSKPTAFVPFEYELFLHCQVNDDIIFKMLKRILGNSLSAPNYIMIKAGIAGRTERGEKPHE